MDFASLIKSARQRAGLSQSQAAAAWGVALKNLQNWEQGANTPSGPQVAKLWPIIQPVAAATAAAVPKKKKKSPSR